MTRNTSELRAAIANTQKALDRLEKVLDEGGYWGTDRICDVLRKEGVVWNDTVTGKDYVLTDGEWKVIPE